MPLFRSPLANALGTAPDADASIYIASAGVTKLEQQIGINKLITYLKAQSLWTTLAGGFLLGNDVQKSGTSLIDLKAGASATLTGGTRIQSGIVLEGSAVDKISVGNRTFTSNFPPSTYILCNLIGSQTTATNSIRAGFSCLNNQSTLRAVLFGHDTTGNASNVIFRADRGTDTIVSSGFSGSISSSNYFIGLTFSANDQKLYIPGAVFWDNSNTLTGGSARTYAANSEWILHCLLNTGAASLETALFSTLLFWDSNVTITRTQAFAVDSLIRSFAL
jgi:hypothetical protein